MAPRSDQGGGSTGANTPSRRNFLVGAAGVAGVAAAHAVVKPPGAAAQESGPAPGTGYVDLTSAQTITGAKTFAAPASCQAAAGAASELARMNVEGAPSGAGFSLASQHAVFGDQVNPLLTLTYNAGPSRVADEGGAGMWIEGNYWDGTRRNMEIYWQYLAADGTSGPNYRPVFSDFNLQTNRCNHTRLAGDNVQFVDGYGEQMGLMNRNHCYLFAPEPTLDNHLFLKAGAGRGSVVWLGGDGGETVLRVFTNGHDGYCGIQRDQPSAGRSGHLLELNNVVPAGQLRLYATDKVVARRPFQFGGTGETTGEEVLATFRPPAAAVGDQAAFMAPGSSTTVTAVVAGGTLLSDDAEKGIVLKDAQSPPHYWRVTVATTGVLETTDLGTARPRA